MTEEIVKEIELFAKTVTKKRKEKIKKYQKGNNSTVEYSLWVHFFKVIISSVRFSSTKGR